MAVETRSSMESKPTRFASLGRISTTRCNSWCCFVNRAWRTCASGPIGGIFSGMNSPLDVESVLAELGEDLPRALVTATDRAREHYATFRKAFPQLGPRLFERDLANLIHALLWCELESELEGSANVTLRASEPYREIGIHKPGGGAYVMRVKRHSTRDRISGYSTQSDLNFWGGTDVAFDGYERVALAVGYRWDRDTHEIGAPVISYRQGKKNVIWARAITGGTSAAIPIHYDPIEPTLPGLTLTEALRENPNDTEEASGQ